MREIRLANDEARNVPRPRVSGLSRRSFVIRHSSLSRGRTRWPVLFALALAAILTIGLLHLFELRYERGDVYPAHSTLRADPLGAKVIFDVLGGMPGYEAQRNFRPLIRLKPRQPVTLIYAGVSFESRWGEDELAEFESLVNTGSRAVFAFQREFKTTNTQRLGTATPKPKIRLGRKKSTPAPTPTPIPGVGPQPTPTPSSTADDDEGIAFSTAAKRWGFAFDLAQDEEREVVQGTAERTEEAGDVEATLPWHSALYFKGLGPQWRVLYRCNGVPVVLERDYGKGSLVLASDSFFLTNEALRTARAPKLLARVVGPPRTVVFDEEHLGVTENMNLAGLARKHGLEGALLTTLLVIALFVWKNAVPFLPAQRRREGYEGEVSGADATEGFVNLLRRSVGAGQILKTCADAWRKAQGRRLRPEELAHVETVLRADGERGLFGKNAAAAYRTIAEGLKRR